MAHLFLDDSEDFAVDLAAVHQFLNLDETEARRQLDRVEGIRTLALEGETLYTTDEKWRRLGASVQEALQTFHASHPLAPGMEMEALRSQLAGRLSPRVFRACIEGLAEHGAAVREGNLLRLPGHQVRLRGDERELVARVKSLLGAQPLSPPDVKQIERDLGLAPARLAELLRVMEREGSIVRVAADLYFLSDSIEEVRTALRRHLTERGTIATSAFRDLFGTSRKYAIPLLEHFDREGLTLRVGDARKLKDQRGAAGLR